MDIKQAIIDRLLLTKRSNMEIVIDYMNKNGFFKYQCHSHHRYVGGLAEHAWQTYQIAMGLNAENRLENPDSPILDEDSIAIAALLHDFCDCSGMRDIGKRKHGKRSTDMLKALGFKLNQQEFLAIRFHLKLSIYRNHFLYNDALNSQLRKLVHKADCISAKKRKGYDDIHAKQDPQRDFATQFVSALETIGITVYDEETKEQMRRDDLIDYLKDKV